MRARSPRFARNLLLLLMLGASALLCRAYTFMQAGVDSNFLIDGDRVLFAQADGSLTALSLDSGEVLARDKSRDYSGTLRLTPQGLLVLSDRSIALVNSTNFSSRWETSFHCAPNLSGDNLVSCDEEGLIQCRRLSDGQVRWSYDLPGTLDIIVESGKVLAHRQAAYDTGTRPTTVLLDLESGRELFRKAPANGTRWAAAFFDGTNVFLEATPANTGTADYEPERMTILDSRGEPAGTLPIPRELRPAIRDGGLFELNGKTFWQGRVYASREAIPFERSGKLSTTAESTNRDSQTFEIDHDLGDGLVLAERAKYLADTNDGTKAFVMELQLRTATNVWTGVLPYLLDRGRLTAIAKADGNLLIGTDCGQVECIEAATGESRWLYVFPTLRRTLSYSSRGLPPMMSEAAAIFRKDNGSPPISGMHVINGTARAPRVILDPEPANPYRRLPLHLAIAWSGAGLSVLLLLLVHLLGWIRKWESSIPGAVAVWLTFLLFCLYLFYGRVSPHSSLALKIAILSGFLFGLVDTVRSCRRGLWLEGTILIITFAGIALFIFLALA